MHDPKKAFDPLASLFDGPNLRALAAAQAMDGASDEEALGGSFEVEPDPVPEADVVPPRPSWADLLPAAGPPGADLPRERPVEPLGGSEQQSAEQEDVPTQRTHVVAEEEHVEVPLPREPEPVVAAPAPAPVAAPTLDKAALAKALAQAALARAALANSALANSAPTSSVQARAAAPVPPPAPAAAPAPAPAAPAQDKVALAKALAKAALARANAAEPKPSAPAPAPAEAPKAPRPPMSLADRAQRPRNALEAARAAAEAEKQRKVVAQLKDAQQLATQVTDLLKRLLTGSRKVEVANVLLLDERDTFRALWKGHRARFANLGALDQVVSVTHVLRALDAVASGQLVVAIAETESSDYLVFVDLGAQSLVAAFPNARTWYAGVRT